MAEWWQTPQGIRRYQAQNPGTTNADINRAIRRGMATQTPFFQQAKALFPSAPDWMLRAYANGLVEHAGAPNAVDMAWLNVREHRRYDQFFAGNRRADGTFRMSEMEYLSYRQAYRDQLAERGLNPQVFDAKFSELVEGNVSAQEFASRLAAVDERIMARGQETLAWYQQNVPGIGMTIEGVYASFLDPKMGEALVNKQLTMAEIGGTASRYGFSRSMADAQRLAERGVNAAAADQLYQGAAESLGRLDTWADRFNDADSDFGIGEYEDLATGDVEQRRRAERLLAAEQSSFSGGGRVRQDQSGGLSGLRQA